jgi:hypothetical protein
VSLSGSGTQNMLSLTGKRTVTSGSETYIAGNGPLDGSLTLGNINYQFSNAIGSVVDVVRTTTPLVVNAFGSSAILSSSNGTQTLSGLSIGGAGDSLIFSSKNTVQLNLLSAGASATLNATAAAALEQTFEVGLSGTGGSLKINATPSTVATSVSAPGAFVILSANSGPVSIAGNSATAVDVLQIVPNVGQVTSGIQANVSVSNVGLLAVDDSGNTTTQENVTVTESTISGTGLFGNNAATLTYTNTPTVHILTGQLADTYIVNGTQGNASFVDITIFDCSHVGLGVKVNLNAQSALDVSLDNLFIPNPAPASLEVVAIGADLVHSRLTPLGTLPPSGFNAASFPGNPRADDVVWQNFDNVTSIPIILPPPV